MVHNSGGANGAVHGELLLQTLKRFRGPVLHTSPGSAPTPAGLRLLRFQLTNRSDHDLHVKCLNAVSSTWQVVIEPRPKSECPHQLDFELYMG